MYLKTGISREMANLLGSEGPVPTSLAGLVGELGGTREAVKVLGDNPRTDKPYAQRDIQRYLDFEKQGKTPNNRQITPQAFNRIYEAVIEKRFSDPFAKMRQRGLAVRGRMKLWVSKPAKDIGARNVVGDLYGEALDDFLAAFQDAFTGAGSADDMAEKFNEAVMAPSGYDFPGALIDPGPDALDRDDFSITYAT